MKEHPESFKFQRMYANLSLDVRSGEIMAVVDGEPMTARVIKQEVDKNSAIGFSAVEQLKNAKVI